MNREWFFLCDNCFRSLKIYDVKKNDNFLVISFYNFYYFSIIIENTTYVKRMKSYFQIDKQTEISFVINSYQINHGDIVFNSKYHIKGILKNQLDDLSKLWHLPTNTQLNKKSNNDTIRIVPPNAKEIFLILN